MAGGREAGGTAVLLEGEARRSAAGAGIADRSSASADEDLSRSLSTIASIGGTGPELKGAESEVWGDVGYDAAGGLQGAAGALQRAGGFVGGSPYRWADAEGDGESDRVLHQHLGDERRFVREAELCGVAGESEGDGAGGLCASGPAF